MSLYAMILAALLFGSSGYFMKLSEGMSKVIPTIGFCLMLVLGGLLQALVLEKTTLGKAYVVVAALEALTTFLIAALLLGERPTVFKVAASGVILGGVVALRMVE